MFSLLNGRHAGFNVGDIAKNSDHGDMLGTNALQIKDSDIARFFGHIRSGDHIDDFALNKTDSGKRNLSFSKDFFTDRSDTLPQEFKDSG